MMDSFGLWLTYVNEIFRISFFLTGGLNGGVRFLFTSFFGHQGFVSNWTLHTTNTIEIPLNFENRTTDGRVMAKYVSPGGQKMN